MIGKTLAHYKITEKIGAGGMGEVYQASDSKLGREVALKMLPAEFAQDAERMARFQREAQVLASLNHPNIAAIYGLEELDQSRVLVLELVKGPTLFDRLSAGRLPVSEALEIARQIAEAVEYAHENGVVHRDLKPANVKVTEDERVKVLDFGLAKAMGDPALVPASGAGDPADSPTLPPTLQSPITGALTGANVILGTAAYMSPEQARGKAIDKRADIWSFGVLLFEMLTGRRLFDGETVSDILAAVLTKEPEWDVLPADTPPRIQRLVRRCLERNPKERLRDIGDARLAIGEVLSGTAAEDELSTVGAAAPTPLPPRRPWVLPAVALASVAVTSVVLSLRQPTSETAALRKYDTPFPAGTRVGEVALAPDGSAIAYRRDGVLYVKELTTLEVRELDDASGIVAPGWSPDGQWIAYGAEMGLWKVRRTGGTPVRIATAPTDGFSVIGCTVWREDGRVFFTTGYASLLAVAAQGGEPEEVVPLGENESDFHEMADLDGQGFAFIVHSTAEDRGIDAIDVVGSDGVRTQVVHYPNEELSDLAWSPTGHLLFRREDDAAGIWAIPLSLSTLQAQGAAFLVAPQAHAPSVAIDGTLVYVTGSRTQETTLAFVDRHGVVLKTVGEPADYHHWPSVSPDGRQIANMIEDGETKNIWFIDVERGSRRRFTRGPGSHSWGSWNSTGRDFWFFDEEYSEEAEIYVTPASGTGERRVVAFGHVPNVSPDGRWLAFDRPDLESSGRNIWLLDLLRDDAEPQQLIEDPARQYWAVFSPTAPLMAYCTEGSGDWEVHLTTYPEREGDWLASTGGGMWPQWREDGQELFYAVGDSIMSVEVDAADGASRPQLSHPRLLFRRPRYAPAITGFPDGFEVMPDGETFVLHVTTGEGTVPPAIVVTQNWIQEFRDGD